MANALSVDLRCRVVEAVEQGMSRRQAATRFGVSAASAVRWHQRYSTTGTVAPRGQGGDRKSKHVEAHAAFILAEIMRQPDMTLAELQARLEQERSARFAIGTLWRFFRRRRITRKKRPLMPASVSARM